jgi:hypothetical protein
LSQRIKWVEHRLYDRRAALAGLARNGGINQRRGFVRNIGIGNS